MKTKAQFLDEILKINPKYNTELIGKAFDKAQELHDGQLRKSGEPYFIHPINVAIILAQLGMDEATIIGGLLQQNPAFVNQNPAHAIGKDPAVLPE